MGPCHELQRFCAGAPRTDIHTGMFDAWQVPSENSALRPNFEGGTLVSVLESARDWHVRMTLRVWVAATQKQAPRTGSHRLAGPMAAEGRTGRSQTSHARFETDSVHPPPTPKARRPRFRPRRILSSNRFVGPCTRPTLVIPATHDWHHPYRSHARLRRGRPCCLRAACGGVPCVDCARCAGQSSNEAPHHRRWTSWAARREERG